MIRKLEFIIDESFAGKTVLVFLKAQGFSSRIIKDIKYNPHGILIKNKKVTVQKQLKKGDRLTVYIREKHENILVWGAKDFEAFAKRFKKDFFISIQK